MNAVMTAQEFNRHISKAQKDCEKHPVFVTKRGSLAYVLINYGEYQRLKGQSENIAQALAAPEEEIDILEDLVFERADIQTRDWTDN